jgi:branched-subunit amino acid transport protein AzlD
MSLSVTEAFCSTMMATAVILTLRAFPFILFSRKEPPAILCFIEKYIPILVMAILVVYCLKDVQLSTAPYGLPHFLALTATVILHLWKKNALISICGGTILFMILNHIF